MLSGGGVCVLQRNTSLHRTPLCSPNSCAGAAAPSFPQPQGCCVHPQPDPPLQLPRAQPVLCLLGRVSPLRAWLPEPRPPQWGTSCKKVRGPPCLCTPWTLYSLRGARGRLVGPSEPRARMKLQRVGRGGGRAAPGAGHRPHDPRDSEHGGTGRARGSCQGARAGEGAGGKNKGSCGLGWSRARQGMGAAGSTPRGWGCLSESRDLGDGEGSWGGQAGGGDRRTGELGMDEPGRQQAGGPAMHRAAGGEERDGGAGKGWRGEQDGAGAG